MGSTELENNLKQVLKFFHSESGDSTEQIRLQLDELLRQNYGEAKTLGAQLPQKYLDEEKKNRNRIPSSSTSSSKNSKAGGSKAQASSASGSASAASGSGTAGDKEDEGTVMDNQLSLELLQEDLACTVCRQMSVQAGNRLLECEGCHALYHQDCHSPVITDDQMTAEWNCSACQVTAVPTSSTSAGPSAAKSLPIIHSNVAKAQGKQTTPVNPGMKVPIPVNPGSKTVTPNINIISADKRLQIMKKKAARQHENKRKHPK